MKVRDLSEKLESLPKDYDIEFHIGTDHFVIDDAKVDRFHKRNEWWKRRRKVVILS